MKPDPRSRPAVLLVAILAMSVLAASAQGKRRAVRKPEPVVLRFTATRYAFTTAGAALDPADAVSMDVLVYQTDDTQTSAGIVKRQNPSDQELYFVRIERSAGAEELVFGGETASGSIVRMHSGVTLPRRNWVHLAVVLNGSVARLFMNGAQVSSAAMSGLAAPSAVERPLLVGEDFPGALRNLRVWRRALSDQEIARIAQGYDPDSTADLAGWWPLDDGAGQAARDIGPNSIPLVLGDSTSAESTDPLWIDAARLSEGPYFELRYLPADPDEKTVAPGQAIVVDATGDGRPDYFEIRSIPKDRAICTYPYYADPAPEQGPSYRNLGNGEFAPDRSIITWTHFAPAFRHYERDFTGDGRADVLLVNTGPEFMAYPGVDCGIPGYDDPADFPGGQSRILVARPEGRLVEETGNRMPERIVYDHGSAVGDIDGDGDLDVLLVAGLNFDTERCVSIPLKPGAPCTAILRNDGTGRFIEEFDHLPDWVSRARRPPPSSDKSLPAGAAAFVDVDRDGDQDLILGGANPGEPSSSVDRIPPSLLLNDGTGHFQYAEGAFPSPIENGAIWIAAGDLNRDGWPDLMCSFYVSLSVYFNNGNGTFRYANDALPAGEASEGADRCDIAELNADGAPDIVCSDSVKSGVRLFYNRGNGTFDRMPPIDALPPANTLFVTDVDGDGLVDLIGNAGLPRFVMFQRKPYRTRP